MWLTPSRAAAQSLFAPIPAAETAPMSVITTCLASAIRLFLFLFHDVNGDGIDQYLDVLGVLKRPVHGNVDIELFFDRRQDHDDVDGLEIEAFDRCVRPHLVAVDHPFFDDHLDNVVDKLSFVLNFSLQDYPR